MLKPRPLAIGILLVLLVLLAASVRFEQPEAAPEPTYHSTAMPGLYFVSQPAFVDGFRALIADHPRQTCRFVGSAAGELGMLGTYFFCEDIVPRECNGSIPAQELTIE